VAKVNRASDEEGNLEDPQTEGEKAFAPAVRLEWVDVVRGIAILDMIGLQIFDVLSKHNIYTDPPYYFASLGWVLPIPPPVLFTFVAGMSVFLLINKLQEQKAKGIIPGVIKRYGIYVLISLPFTWFMWNLSTYLHWEEAIQGIGLTAIFLSLILLAKPKNSHILAMVFGFAALQAVLFYFTKNLVINPLIDVLLNALVRGWFAVVNLLPLMLGGVLFFKFIKSGKPLKGSLALATVFLVTGIVLHLAGLQIDYYGRSFAFSLFAVGLAALITLSVFYIWKKLPSVNWRPFVAFGQASFAVYVGHYLLILKPAQIFGVKDTMPDWLAFLFMIALVTAVYFATEVYLHYKSSLKKFA